MTMNATISGASSGEKTLHMNVNGSFSPGSHTGQLTMNMRMPGVGVGHVGMQIVLDGHMAYVKMPAQLRGKMPGGKPWLSMNLQEIGKASGIPGYGSLLNSSSSSYSDPGQYLNYLRAASDGSVKDVGQTTIDGVQTTEYQAEVDLTKLPNAIPAAAKQSVKKLAAILQSEGVNTEMPVGAWIDASNHVRRIQTSYEMSIGGVAVTMNITENLSDYGPQPAPPVPSPAETTNLSSLTHGTLTQGTLTTEGA